VCSPTLAQGGDTREREWFTPEFGPNRFRLLVGLTFYPYTLMNVSYTVIGSMAAPGAILWDRVSAIAIVYLLATGVAAHSFDAMAPNKPWGAVLSRRQLLALAFSALVPALGIGIYYSVRFSPFIIPIGILELFFLFAYNLELFGGHFHTDIWFAFSWGGLPVLAGYVMQTNALSVEAVALGAFGFLTAFAEINASRPYKVLKKLGKDAPPDALKFENILKAMVASHIVLALALVLYRLM
jgi:hypothetical protein